MSNRLDEHLFLVEVCLWSSIYNHAKSSGGRTLHDPVSPFITEKFS